MFFKQSLLLFYFEISEIWFSDFLQPRERGLKIFKRKKIHICREWVREGCKSLWKTRRRGEGNGLVWRKTSEAQNETKNSCWKAGSRIQEKRKKSGMWTELGARASGGLAVVPACLAKAAFLRFCRFLASLGGGRGKHKEIKKKLCVSLQNKALVKNSVCSRDSVLTWGAWQLLHLHNLSHEESRSKWSN